MPKESFTLKKFSGMSPSNGGDISPLLVKNMRLDMPDTVAYPESSDTVDYTNPDLLGERDPDVIRKTMYVDGKNVSLSVSRTGVVRVDGSPIGFIASVSNIQIDVIGRQAVISSDGSPSKVVRVGYPGKKHIGFTLQDIIFEDDRVAESNAVFGQYRDFIPLNDENILLLLSGSNALVMMYLDGIEWKVASSIELCESEITSIGYSISSYGDSKTKHGFIDYVYYSFLDNNVLKIGKYDVSSSYASSHTNISSGFDVTLFEAQAPETGIVTVALTPSEVPSGFIHKGIAVTENKVFVSLCATIGGSFVSLGVSPSITIDSDEDLLYSFDVDNFDGGAANVAVATNTLYKSMLPWNPYVEHSVRMAFGTDGTPSTYYSKFPSQDGVPSTGTIWLPDRITSAVDNRNTDFNTLAIYDLAREAANDGMGGDFTGYITLPGNCGAKAESVTPTGSIVVIDYANDIVGYLVRINGSSAGFPVATATPSIQETDWDNGCGLIRTRYYSSVQSQIGRDSYMVAAYNSATVPDDAFIECSDAYCFYCWNGVQESSVYRSFAWETYDEDCYVDVYKVFDNTIVSGSSSSRSRFVLIPDVKILSCDGAYSSQFTEADSLTIRSIVAAGTTPPVLLARVQEDNNYSNIAIDGISSWRATAGVTSGGASRLVPDKANRILSTNNSNASIGISDLDNGYDPAVTPVISNCAIGNSSTAELPAQFLSVTPYAGDGDVSISKTVTQRYKAAFILDGISTSPLSSYSIDIDASDLELTSEQLYYYTVITVAFKLSWMRSISKRITGVSIYAAEVTGTTETTLYRLVSTLDLTANNFSYSSSTHLYSATISDYGNRGAAFNQIAGYSEAVTSVSVTRGCQCMSQNYLFAGNISVDYKWGGSLNTNNLVVRSLPFQPSVFNYAEDFTVLTFTPIALVPYNGRVYAFGERRYSIINQDTLSVEFTSESCGAVSKNHVVATDVGIFVFYSGNMYIVDGQSCSPVGDGIKTSIGGYPGLSTMWADNILVGYVQSRNMVIVTGAADFVIYMFGFNLDTKRWGVFSLGVENSGDDQYPVSMYQEQDKYYVVVYGEYLEGGLGYMTYCLFDSSDSRNMTLEYLMSFGDEDTEKIVYAASVAKNTAAVPSGVYVNGETRLPVKAKTAIVKVESPEPITAISFIIRRLVLTK